MIWLKFGKFFFSFKFQEYDMKGTERPKYYFNTRDLVVIATLTAIRSVIAVSSEPLIRGLVHGVLHLPGPGTGMAIFGWFSFVIWMLLAYGLTLKKGSVFLTSILMGIVTAFTGMGPIAGIIVLPIFIGAGLCMELGLLLKHSSVKYLAAGVLGNIAFFILFISMAGFYKGQWLLASFIPIATVIGAISGLVGGLVTISLLVSLRKAGLAPSDEKQG
jgi:hypothetical protein